MSWRDLAAMMLMGCLLASGAARAQVDDDLLAPLAPADSKSKKKKPDTTPPKKKAPKPSDELAPLVPTKSDLTVKLATAVPQAKLLVDGVDQGVLPVAPVSLSPGDHRVEVRRPGYRDFVKTVTLKAGAPMEVAVTLEPIAGVLAVRANVDEAEVVIDGRPSGNAPVADIPLAPGNHEIEVRRPGYEPFLAKLAVRAGKDYPVDVTLRPVGSKAPDAVARTDRPEQTNLTPTGPAGQPSPLGTPVKEVASGGPWYGNWVVWAGVGTVVAAAAVGTAVAMNRSPQPIDSRTVCGGRDCDAVINPPAIFLPPAGLRF